MNHNNDSTTPQSTFIDEGRGAPELPEKSGCSVGPENLQISRAGVLVPSHPSVPVAMDYNFFHQKVESPGSNWTCNTSVNTINSPLKNVATGSFTNSFSVSGSESVILSSPSPQISSSPVTLNNPPARKRLKLTENDRTSVSEDISGLRRRILEYKLLRRRIIREKYAENSAEYFYLQAGGNIMDYHAWRKRPPTPQLITHLRTYRLDSKDENEDLIKVLCRGMSNSQTAPQGAEIKIPGVGATPVAISTTLPAAVAQLTQRGGTPLVVESSGNLKTFSTVSSLAAASLQPTTQEQIVEKAKQEAYVMQRISELQKEGLWTEKRLPKVMEPPRPKAHWDYLLEEMIWLAADFAQERKWKKAAAKKCARMVQKYFQEKALAAQKAEKAQELQLRRIASFVAKEIKIFWSNVEKLVEFKQQTKLEEERRRALDQQLSFIVDQTEKYSQQLAEGMRSHTKHTSSKGSSTSALPSDDEFCPSGAISSDDEETIAAAEKEDKNHGQETTKAEVEALQRESQMDLDEFLNELPANYLENRDKIKLSDNESENGSSGGEGGDSEFQADEDSSDDEDTIMEQEKQEGQKDHKKEIDDLKAESEMSIDELMKKYSAPLLAGKTASPIISDKEDSDESNIDDISEDENTEYTDDDDEEEGLDALVKESNVKEGEEDHRMEDAAAIAESIQPKGNTLSSTQVVTKVPFLLKHCLREYQHIGLDWLVTMEQRRLNGILADEMGLGKTIQTIALLSHLACEKHDWGPHLIIVPTSVMLNWEMECKKWCPSFKILTYYGSIKERKLKRIGWTKPNAFHICITSYKLVIQDHHSFRRKKWKYLILDEAQNIKNFKSQRWQLLLNFQTQQRLLLTGTPLQNNLMELWSLMHFLMPDIFASHREFKEWFSNPVTGMIEGNSEYNENIIKRLHKVLRPFLLRRLKSEVEKQMPKKYEHVIMCRLSKRQRFLYDDFMSRAKTRETLATGNMLSVINILMQLRKVCNHPNLFEVRPTISPFQMEPIHYRIPSLVYNMLNYEPLKDVDLTFMNLNFPAVEERSAFSSYQINLLTTPRRLIEEVDSAPAPPPRCPPAKYRLHLTLNSVTEQSAGRTAALSTHLMPPAGASPRPDMLRTISQVFPDQNKNMIPPSARQRPILRVPPLQSGDAPAVGVAADPPLSTNGLGAPTALGARVALFSPLTPRAHRQLSSARTAQVSPIVREKSPELNSDQQVQAEFYQQSVEECLKQRRRYKLKVINSINERRCGAFPLYGADLRNCCAVSKQFCDILQRDVSTVDSYIHQMNNIFDRFIVFICGAVSSGIKPFVSHGSVWKRQQEERLQDDATATLKPVFLSMHPVASRLATHFPDPRLIQYDCGKLQTMDVLLRRLRSEQHRVLIFTQMTRMLDVLEAFLNFHGYIYLRLDGTTRIEQRQILMERFNNDSRIFAFILSTRSGGVGVNLTGADTVIFYDSDWNPTMDAQAQDRCHRIGQTRDVHIYRLISEKTVEENILKKANQKRMLGDVAIEGGNFTTAYFKSTTIQELFNVAAGERAAAVLSDETEATAILESSVSGGANLENALAQCEDEADVAAARTARAEAAADLAEFDENIPIEEQQQPTLRPELSKAELELQAVMDQLSPVERYAMRLVESSEAATSAERIAAADLERQRRDWQAARRAIAPLSPVSPGSPDDPLTSDLTFSRDDADNQVSDNKPSVVNKRFMLMRRSGRCRSSIASLETSPQINLQQNNGPKNQLIDANHSESTKLIPFKLKSRRGRPLKNKLNVNCNSLDIVCDQACESQYGNLSQNAFANKSNALDHSLLVEKPKKRSHKIESPRTRSRGGLKLNLFNLDVSPIQSCNDLAHSQSDFLQDKTSEDNFHAIKSITKRMHKKSIKLRSLHRMKVDNCHGHPIVGPKLNDISVSVNMSSCNITLNNVSDIDSFNSVNDNDNVISSKEDFTQNNNFESLENHSLDNDTGNCPNSLDHTQPIDADSSLSTSISMPQNDSNDAGISNPQNNSGSLNESKSDFNGTFSKRSENHLLDGYSNTGVEQKRKLQICREKKVKNIGKLSNKVTKPQSGYIKKAKRTILNINQRSLDSWVVKKPTDTSAILINQPIVSIKPLTLPKLPSGSFKEATTLISNHISVVKRGKGRPSIKSKNESNNEI